MKKLIVGLFIASSCFQLSAGDNDSLIGALVFAGTAAAVKLLQFRGASHNTINSADEPSEAHDDTKSSTDVNFVDVKAQVQTALDKANWAFAKATTDDQLVRINQDLVNTMKGINENLHEKFSDQVEDEVRGQIVYRLQEKQAAEGKACKIHLLSGTIRFEDEVEIARRFMAALSDDLEK